MKPTRKFIATIKSAPEASRLNAAMHRYLQWVILSNVRNNKNLDKNTDLMARHYLSVSSRWHLA